MPGFIGIPELLILFVVLLLIFGPKRIPEMGRSLGRGIHEFKDSITGQLELEPPREEPTATQTARTTEPADSGRAR
jgi:sec-independent protein translocase protein TatA